MCTALEYPARGSQGVPDEIFSLLKIGIWDINSSHASKLIKSKTKNIDKVKIFMEQGW